MSADFAPAAPRPKMLFLSFTYPTSGGSGIQLRSAALLRMLAKNADVHLLIAGYVEKLGGPRDRKLEKCCRQIAYLRILPGAETRGAWARLNTQVEPIDLPAIDCAQGEAAERIVRFYQANNLDCLFVFRLEALHFVGQRLDFFPLRYLDLDELPSRRMAQIRRLKPNDAPGTLSTRQKTVGTVEQILERVLLPRFHRVFVASALEADEVRRLTGFSRCLMLPNIYPARPDAPARRIAARSEIFFVGTLGYYPNADAALYFCREILPLIREKKDVLFRIVGMGSSEALECMSKQSGVELMGYQENLAPFYAQAALFAVPLRAGTGTRLKILEAFAHGCVVVSTSIGAEGLAVTDRKNILLADDPAAFAQACIEMIDNPELAAQIAAEASRLHRELYSDEALLRCYANITTAEYCDISVETTL